MSSNLAHARIRASDIRYPLPDTYGFEVSASLPEVLQAWQRAARADIWTIMPCKVLSFNENLNTVTVRPVVQEPYRNAEGEIVAQDLPEIPDVQVVWPGTGGYIMTSPLAQGDTLLLVFTTLDVTEWEQTGVDGLPPPNVQRHGLGSCFAMPNVCRPVPQGLNISQGAIRQAGMILGKEGDDNQIRIKTTEIQLWAGSTEAVALASQVVAALNVIKAAAASGSFAAFAAAVAAGIDAPLNLIPALKVKAT